MNTTPLFKYSYLNIYSLVFLPMFAYKPHQHVVTDQGPVSRHGDHRPRPVCLQPWVWLRVQQHSRQKYGQYSEFKSILAKNMVSIPSSTAFMPKIWSVFWVQQHSRQKYGQYSEFNSILAKNMVSIPSSTAFSPKIWSVFRVQQHSRQKIWSIFRVQQHSHQKYGQYSEFNSVLAKNMVSIPTSTAFSPKIWSVFRVQQHSRQKYSQFSEFNSILAKKMVSITSLTAFWPNIWSVLLLPGNITGLYIDDLALKGLFMGVLYLY